MWLDLLLEEFLVFIENISKKSFGNRHLAGQEHGDMQSDLRRFFSSGCALFPLHYCSLHPTCCKKS